MRKDEIGNKYEWAHHRYVTGIKSVIVGLAKALLMVPEKTPELERRDGHWVIAAKYICAFHNIPRGRMYL